ncbi:unnamed protein product [Anisakis simplex]|uniref:Fer4_19 domain-containing protein n=1 Tax=Anisakis simplex TaxID=6269 RepID=A0A0M3IZZ4_ANISI|nr:unnamed protein product [Anisakis simplex]
MRRLRVTCTQLDFLDPPCNMIVDEYGQKIYIVVVQNIPEEQACKQFGICPPKAL